MGDILPIEEPNLNHEWHTNKKNTIKSPILASIILDINRTSFSIREKIKLKNIFLSKLPNKGNFSFITTEDSQEIRKKFSPYNRELNLVFKERKIYENILTKKVENITIINLIINFFPELKDTNIKGIQELYITILNDNLL